MGVTALRFTKMEGLGNDYIYVNGFDEKLDPERLPQLAVAVSDRHFGVGSDGLILILPSDKADFRMRMFNADGSEGEMCGNGIRCFSRYVYDRGLTKKTCFEVETGAGLIRPEIILRDGQVYGVRVDMGEPRLVPEQIPIRGQGPGPVIDHRLEACGEEFSGTAVSMGNPHFTVFVDDVAGVDLERVGGPIETHPDFPRRVNVHFAQVLGPSEIRMRTWERGSGITLACGTGACATLVAAALTGRAGRQATVYLPGGPLEIEWAAGNRVYMTGPANFVCDGVFLRA